MNSNQMIDQALEAISQSQKGNRSILDVYLDLKDLSKDITALVKDIEGEAIEECEMRFGDRETSYRGRNIKIVSKVGTIDYSNVPDIVDLQSMLELQKGIYKRFLISLEKGNAKIKDGCVITDDGEMIKKENFPFRKKGATYIRSSKEIKR